MKFTAITALQAMKQMRGFVQSSSTEKVLYVRERYKRLKEPDISGIADEEILEGLKENEARMMRFVNQYEAVKDSVTPGLLLDASLVELFNVFINDAVSVAIETILETLTLSEGSPQTAASKQIDTFIDKLFDDRAYLEGRLTLMLSLIRDPQMRSDILYSDLNTFNLFYKPVAFTGNEPVRSFGIAFLDWMGVEPCMLINYQCLENNALYISKVVNFFNEYNFYVFLHELVHLLLDADDETYSISYDEPIEKASVYATDRLNSHELDNVDNYCVLIFIVLSHLHKNRRLDLSQF